jgi:hypothetical protein
MPQPHIGRPPGGAKVAFKTSFSAHDYGKLKEIAEVEGETPQDVLRRLVAFYVLVNAKPDMTDGEIIAALKESH